MPDSWNVEIEKYYQSSFKWESSPGHPLAGKESFVSHCPPWKFWKLEIKRWEIKFDERNPVTCIEGKNCITNLHQTYLTGQHVLVLCRWQIPSKFCKRLNIKKLGIFCCSLSIPKWLPHLVVERVEI